MYEKHQFYCVGPDWQEGIAKSIGGEFVADKIIVLPETLGSGHTFFLQVIPGIAVFLMDFILKTKFEIKRLEDDVERYIFHYDLSDHANIINIGDKNFKVGYTINLGLAVLNNQDKSFFVPALGKRTFALRIWVDKKLMDGFIEHHPNTEYAKRKITISKNELFYYNYIDSNSILELLTLKEKSVFDDSYDPNIKGITLKLLSNFLNRDSDPMVKERDDSEKEALEITKKYLLDNLYNPFPSIPFLSKMAGMSSSRFKILFKKYFSDTPKNVFIHEKMLLAHELLQSGDFNTLTEVVYELNYTKLDYFSSKYFDVFKRKPSEDFLKNRNT